MVTVDQVAQRRAPGYKTLKILSFQLGGHKYYKQVLTLKLF